MGWVGISELGQVKNNAAGWVAEEGGYVGWDVEATRPSPEKREPGVGASEKRKRSVMDGSDFSRDQAIQSGRESEGGGSDESLEEMGASEVGYEAGAPVTSQGLWGLLERQKYRCALTGWELTPETATLDHRIPLSKGVEAGGTHTIDNIQILHSVVNRAKNTMTNEEFVEMCRAVLADKTSLALPDSVAEAARPIQVKEMATSRDHLQKAINTLDQRLRVNPSDDQTRKVVEGMRRRLAKM